MGGVPDFSGRPASALVGVLAVGCGMSDGGLYNTTRGRVLAPPCQPVGFSNRCEARGRTRGDACVWRQAESLRREARVVETL